MTDSFPVTFDPCIWLDEMKLRKSTNGDPVVLELNQDSNRKCFVFCGSWKGESVLQLPRKCEREKESVGYFFAFVLPSGSFFGGVDFVQNQRVSSVTKRLSEWSGDNKCRVLGCTSPHQCDLVVQSLNDKGLRSIIHETEKSRLSCGTLVPYSQLKSNTTDEQLIGMVRDAVSKGLSLDDVIKETL